MVAGVENNHGYHHLVVDHQYDQQNHKPKWEGKASVELKSLKPSQVWPLLEDFFGLNKWFPTLAICLPVEGVSGQPGCVRYCAGFKTPVDEKSNKTRSCEAKERVNWTKQKLLAIDSTQRVFTYAIVDGNVGFNSYVSTVRVGPDGAGDGCCIEWWYEVEPVEGWKPQDLDNFIGGGLRVMASRMEAALQAYFEVIKS